MAIGLQGNADVGQEKLSGVFRQQPGLGESQRHGPTRLDGVSGPVTGCGVQSRRNIECQNRRFCAIRPLNQFSDRSLGGGTESAPDLAIKDQIDRFRAQGALYRLLCHVWTGRCVPEKSQAVRSNRHSLYQQLRADDQDKNSPGSCHSDTAVSAEIVCRVSRRCIMATAPLSSPPFQRRMSRR